MKSTWFKINVIISLLPLLSFLTFCIISYLGLDFNTIHGVLLLIFVGFPPLGLISCIGALTVNRKEQNEKSATRWILFFMLTNLCLIMVVVYLVMTFDLNPVGM